MYTDRDGQMNVQRDRKIDRLTKGQKDKLIQINGWTDKHADKGKALLLC